MEVGLCLEDRSQAMDVRAVAGHGRREYQEET